MPPSDDFLTALADVRRGVDALQFSVVAKHLARRSVLVEWQPLEDCRGKTTLRGGQVVITIDPELEPDDKLEVFCHEVAHARLHVSSLTDNGAPTILHDKIPPRLLAARRHREVQREQEAKALAAGWLLIAGSGRMYERLQRLLKV